MDKIFTFVNLVGMVQSFQLTNFVCNEITDNVGSEK